MKFSTATLAALAATVAAQEATTTTANTEVYKREADAIAGDLSSIIDEFVSMQKRDVTTADSTAELAELLARQLDGSVYGELLKRDGVDWSSIFQQILSALPGLIKSIWDSGIIQNIVSSVWNSAWFKNFLNSALNWVLNLIKSFFSGSGSGSSAAAAPSATAAATANQKRALLQAKRSVELIQEMVNDPTLTARDFADSLGLIISAIWNSGAIQSVFNWVVTYVKEHPEIVNTVISYVGKAITWLWNWLNTSGLLQKGLDWLGANIGTILKTVLNFITTLFGGSGSTTTPTTSAAPPPAATTLQKRMMY